MSATPQCEQCDRRCAVRLPHPTRVVTRRDPTYGMPAYATPMLVCVRCIDELRRAAGAAPVRRPKPIPSLELWPARSDITRPRGRKAG
mgnify:CR=1 FL=1